MEAGVIEAKRCVSAAEPSIRFCSEPTASANFQPTSIDTAPFNGTLARPPPYTHCGGRRIGDTGRLAERMTLREIVQPGGAIQGCNPTAAFQSRRVRWGWMECGLSAITVSARSSSCNTPDLRLVTSDGPDRFQQPAKAKRIARSASAARPPCNRYSVCDQYHFNRGSSGG